MKLARLRFAALATLLTLTSGCGLLIGTVKPVEEKSESYAVMDLSRLKAGWKKLPSSNQNSADTGTSDLAYQSEKNSSIISLNSACRATFATSEHDLKHFTDQLFLGISDVTRRDEQALTVEGLPALQTTLTGKVNGESMTLRTVVIHRGECVYDLMYVARPDQFAVNETDFSQFVASLKLR